MAPKIKIQGKPSEIAEQIDSDFHRIEKSFRIDAVRGQADVIDIGADADDIIGLEFEDGGEWISHVDDIHQIFGDHIQVRGNDDVFPIHISSNENERGIREIGIKVLNLIKAKKKITTAAAKLLAINADRKIMSSPGLYHVSTKGTLQTKKFENKPLHYLLFLHGTISSFKGTFGDLFSEQNITIPSAIHEKYGDKVIALQHYTLSESPWQNAIEILNALPKGSTVDIISHSRGGLIADILACADPRNNQPVYRNEDIALARTSDETFAKSLETINSLASKKQIKVDNLIRVACPARGTEILGSNLDHFLNGLLYAIGLAFGGKANPLYQIIRGLITDIISARLTPGVMPGLLAMVPESIPSNLLNRAGVTLKNQLIVIEGDSEAGKKFWRSVLVVLTNLYYREANDFVVNTSSMRYGALRESGLQFFRSQDDTTSHFNYFKNENTQQAILDALITPSGQAIKRFESRSSGEIDRGVFVDLFKKYKAISYDKVSGDKPVVIVLPGIMGSHLSVEDNMVWLDLGEIGKGHMVTLLSSDNTSVESKFIIGEFYEKLVKFLLPSHDVVTMAYDWRLPVANAAKKLDTLISDISSKAIGQPISIVAHSMGGLVVRDTMRLHQDNWNQFISRKDSRVILLGTPWMGSHLIMQVFTGHLSRVRQLNLLDTHHTKEELIRVFNAYPGLYDLLPVPKESDSFETPEFWEQINSELNSDKIQIPPLLDYFKKYKNEIQSFKSNLDNLYYLAGKDDLTTCAYRIRKTIFGKKLQYMGTPEGDGSVTWSLGIPKNLPAERIYFAHNTEHGNLANDEKLFEGIRDLITMGATANLEKNPPAIDTDRSSIEVTGFNQIKVMPETMVSNRAEEALTILQGQKPAKAKEIPKDDYIEVSVVHGDLKIASHPVMVGHFKDDGIVNAEAAIDHYYEGNLSDRHRISHYPGAIGESLVLFDTDKNPPGTIVIGLGDPTTLTPYQLRKSVESGMVRYAMHFRDNYISGQGRSIADHASSISCLLIGTSYGNLPMEVALNAILTGISKANKLIKTIHRLIPIKSIEFIEIFEHIAQNAYYQLSELERNTTSLDLNIRLNKNIIKKTGAKRKYQFSIENSWWHNLTSRLEKDNSKNLPTIKFTSSSGIARVEEENTFTSQKIIHSLLDQMAIDQGVWNKTYSKSLFEILIPNSFKEILRHQNNILWKMDIDTASYPWELFHDIDIDVNPTFVRAGLIRQLYTPAEQKADIMHLQRALVIADPKYSNDGPSQLPGARKEGKEVEMLLQKEFETNSLVNSSGLDIINELYNQEYKIWHIAGHGTVSKDPNETGIVLENGMFITPSMLKNMSRLPEFVFINCCYSGTVEPAKEKLYQQRYQFAANIGTQLIARGVQAVVVAGWPVNDNAALLFASTFYMFMLSGKNFGDAVRLSREACYKVHGISNNTWGAYQCYGDQWYRLTSSTTGNKKGNTYFTTEQVLIDLYNLLTDTKDRKLKPIEIEKKLITLLQDANKMINSQILELKAEILSELNLIDQAVKTYTELRQINNSNFTVRSLEQFNILRVKQLLINVIADKNLKPRYIQSRLKEVLHDFDSLLLIGATPERLSIMGGAYKKMALIHFNRSALSNKNSLINASLKKALTYYIRACNKIDPKDIRSLNYPLLNALTIHAMLSKEKSIRLFKNKPILISKVLSDAKNDIINSSDRFVDFWKDVNLANILQCELLYAPDKEIAALKDEFIKKYSRVWKLAGTLKQLQTKLEHLDFLWMGVEVMDRPVKWKKKMREMIGDMKKEFEKWR